MEHERLIVIKFILRRHIGWEATLREITEQEKDLCIFINSDETQLWGVQLSDFGRRLEIAIQNPKFKEVHEEEGIPRYDLITAKEKFPFLFKE